MKFNTLLIILVIYFMGILMGLGVQKRKIDKQLYILEQSTIQYNESRKQLIEKLKELDSFLKLVEPEEKVSI